MKEYNSIVKFNALKHHYSFLRTRVEQWADMEWSVVSDELQELGNNQFDVYMGVLSVEEIIREVNEYLEKHGKVTRPSLQKWLGKAGYKTLLLYDGSRWVIRESESMPNPVHLHPGRNQLLVRRIRATHLKTAIALALSSDNSQTPITDCTTEEINTVRSSMLGLSPIRSISESCRIRDTIRFLTSESYRF